MEYNSTAKFVKFFIKGPTYKAIKDIAPELNNKEYKKRVSEEYKNIILRTEGIGGKKNPMEVILYFTAFAIAVYKCADDKISEEDFSKTIDAITSSKMMEISSKSSGAFSKKTIDMYRELNERSKEKKYKNDWVAEFEYKEGSGEYFVTYSECGVCKLCRQEGVFHLVKYMCKMDYPSFEFKKAVLDRTKTLGYEDEVCNFHIMTRERAKEINFVKSKDAK